MKKNEDENNQRKRMSAFSPSLWKDLESTRKDPSMLLKHYSPQELSMGQGIVRNHAMKNSSPRILKKNPKASQESKVKSPKAVGTPRARAEPQLDTGAGGRKYCNCKKSNCLKLYCECFSSGEYCSNCNCTQCFNNVEHEAKRKEAIRNILERNPNAFRPKIAGSLLASPLEVPQAHHSKGCACKRSSCLKKYCECFNAGIFCSENCKCGDCKNYEGSHEREMIMEAISKDMETPLAYLQKSLLPTPQQYSVPQLLNDEPGISIAKFRVLDMTSPKIKPNFTFHPILGLSKAPEDLKEEKQQFKILEFKGNFTSFKNHSLLRLTQNNRLNEVIAKEGLTQIITDLQSLPELTEKATLNVLLEALEKIEKKLKN